MAATTKSTWKEGENIYGISAVPEGLTRQGEIDGGLPAVVSPSLRPSPHASRFVTHRARHSLSHCAPHYRGGASASFAHWGIAAVAAIGAVVAF